MTIIAGAFSRYARAVSPSPCRGRGAVPARPSTVPAAVIVMTSGVLLLEGGDGPGERLHSIVRRCLVGEDLLDRLLLLVLVLAVPRLLDGSPRAGQRGQVGVDRRVGERGQRGLHLRVLF